MLKKKLEKNEIAEFYFNYCEKSGPYQLVIQSDINKTTKFNKLNKFY